MSKIISLSVDQALKKGSKKAKRSKKKNLEDFGQLNMFDGLQMGKSISFRGAASFFQQALELHDSQPAEATKLYQLAIKNSQSVADSYCNLGILKFQENQLLEAVDLLTKALRNDARNYEAHYNLGNVYTELGNFELGKTHYELALLIEPEFIDCIYNLGMTLVAQHQFDLAKSHLEKYINLTQDLTVREILETLEELTNEQRN